MMNAHKQDSPLYLVVLCLLHFPRAPNLESQIVQYLGYLAKVTISIPIVEREVLLKNSPKFHVLWAV